MVRDLRMMCLPLLTQEWQKICNLNNLLALPWCAISTPPGPAPVPGMRGWIALIQKAGNLFGRALPGIVSAIYANFPPSSGKIPHSWLEHRSSLAYVFCTSFSNIRMTQSRNRFHQKLIDLSLCKLCFTFCASADGKRKQHLGSNKASIAWSWPWKAPCWCGFYKSKLLRQPINLDRSTSCLWTVFEKSFSWWNILGLTQVLVATAWASFHDRTWTVEQCQILRVPLG